MSETVLIPFTGDQGEQARLLLGAASELDLDPAMTIRVVRAGFKVPQDVFDAYSTVMAGGPGEVETDEQRAEREAAEKAEAEKAEAEKAEAEKKAKDEAAAAEKAKAETAKKTTAKKAADKKPNLNDVLGDPEENS